ncbi:MAG: DUF2628 domain-containing protein [Beijerinckiaceae bacterium]|jgi:hypothetical protein|nr:DUF2628 domain-containing protein [Beijerinckiaceae bacterium]
MAIYTVHVKGDPADPALAERTVLVKDGFSVAALIFGPIWLVWNRLWLGLALWLLAEAAILALTIWLIPGARGLSLLEILVALLLGLEGSQLRRAALRRRGYTAVDIVSAPREEAAERVFFERTHPDESQARRSATSPPLRLDPGMVGLFPSVSGRTS